MVEATPDLCKIMISSRIARKYYGVAACVAFKPDEHESWRKYWSKCEGRHQIETMQGMVRKGDVLEELKPIAHHLYRTQLCVNGPFRSASTHIYVFDDGIAPVYNDHNVKFLANLTADLSSIPTTRYQTVIGTDSEQYYEIHYEIKATFFSAHTEYSLWHLGQRYGSVEAEYAA